MKFIYGLIIGGAAVWFAKAQIATWTVWTWDTLKAKLAKKK